jgi:MFS family permease
MDPVTAPRDRLRRIFSIKTFPAFRAMQHRDFRLLWLGLGTGGIGDTIQLFAVGWLMVEIAIREGQPARAPLYLGLAGLSRAVPALTLGVFGGVLADRMDRRLLLMLAQVGSVLVALALAAMVVRGEVSVVPVLLLSAIGATMYSVDLPTRQSLLSRIVPGQDLLSAVGLTQAASNAAMLLGPLIGGILILPFGIGGLILVNALAHAVTLVLLFRIRGAAGDPSQARRVNVLRSVWEGLSYVAREPVLRWVVAMSVVSGIGLRPLAQVMPAFAANHLGVGAVELSWLLATLGAGTLAGSLTSASLGSFARPGVILGLLLVAWGGTAVGLSLQTALGPALGSVVFVGAFHFTFSGIALTLMQTRTPDHLRGRTISIYVLTIVGASPLGAFVLGSAGSVLGIETAMRLGGVVGAALGLFVLFRVRAMRDVGRLREQKVGSPEVIPPSAQTSTRERG